MKNCKSVRLLISLLIIFVISGHIHSQTATILNPRFDGIRAKIMEAVTNAEVPSMSVAVAKDGKVIWEESFGWANREKMIKATPHTMYSMASISKPITTTGLMILVEKGLVDLDEPVDTYIAPAALTAHEGDAADATVTHILNHTSGLPLHYTVFFKEDIDRQPPAFPESIRRYGLLVHPPGEVYQYSNFAFALADHIITKVSGTPYREYMKTEVFLPLGMTHTSIDVGPGLEEYQAIRYNNDGQPVSFYISDHPGASQVYCSAHDLIRFGLFHLKHTQPNQKQIITKDTIDLMKRDSSPNPDLNGYGLGWFLRENEYGYPVVWHTGSMRGTNTMLKFVPSEDIAVVVLTNTNTDLRVKITNDIIGVMLPDYDEKWQVKRDKPREEREPFKAVEELTGEWQGEIKTYEETVPIMMIFQEDGDIHVKIENQAETLLNSARFNDDWLTGSSYGDIPSGDAMEFPHSIGYKMLLKDNMLSGYVHTYFKSTRYYCSFSSYIRLEKKK